MDIFLEKEKMSKNAFVTTFYLMDYQPDPPPQDTSERRDDDILLLSLITGGVVNKYSRKERRILRNSFVCTDSTSL